MSTFLGIDLGTQSLKAIVYDAEQRRVVAAGSSELPTATTGSHSSHSSSWTLR